MISLLFITILLAGGVGEELKDSDFSLAISPISPHQMVILLREEVKKNLEEEKSLLRKMREEIRMAVRPYTEYLGYQQGFHFSGDSTRLEQLRRERGALMQGMALLGETDQPLLGDFPTYSGAPLLSFYDPGQFDPPRPAPPHPFRANLFRFLLAAILLSIYSLPGIAMYQITVAERRRTRAARIYPIFRVRGWDGRLEVLQVP